MGETWTEYLKGFFGTERNAGKRYCWEGDRKSLYGYIKNRKGCKIALQIAEGLVK